MTDVSKIWDMLDVVLFSPPARAGVRQELRTDTPKLGEFSPMMLLGTMGGAENDVWYFSPRNVDRPDIVWPLDQSILVDKRGADDVDDWGVDVVAMATRVQSIDGKLLRGKTSKVFPYMLRFQFATIMRGAYVSADTYLGWCNGRWVDSYHDAKVWASVKNKDILTLRHPNFSGYDKKTDDAVKMCQAVALRARYAWTVSFSIYGGPQVKMETDPSGIRALFKDREKDAISNRRAALRNWISDHWRKSRFDEQDEIYVRNHLRGAMSFKWGGFDCVVSPSQFDLEKNKRLADLKQSGASIYELKREFAA